MIVQQRNDKDRLMGFTLVELLVVVAIITVLAAMLLPTLEKALELSRRMSCLNNQRQLYIQINNYASDWTDRLPFQAHLETYGSVVTGETYWAPANAPIRHFLNTYAGVDMPIDKIYNAGAYSNKKALVCCPSRTVPFNGGWIHYGFTGFGVFNLFDSTNIAKQSYGTTRLGLVAQTTRIYGYPNAPVLPFTMILDLVPKNHGISGGNAMIGDGSGKWIDGYNWSNASGGEPLAPCRVYYSQWSYGSGFWGPPETSASAWKMYYNAHKVLGYSF